MSLIESAKGLSDDATIIVASAMPSAIDGSTLNALLVQSPGQLHNAADWSCEC